MKFKCRVHGPYEGEVKLLEGQTVNEAVIAHLSESGLVLDGDLEVIPEPVKKGKKK